MSAKTEIVRNTAAAGMFSPRGTALEMPVPYAFYAMEELGFTHFPIVESGYLVPGAFAMRNEFAADLAEPGNLPYVRERAKAFA